MAGVSGVQVWASVAGSSGLTMLCALASLRAPNSHII